jgi:predicted nuclease with TOPRIM domain
MSNTKNIISAVSKGAKSVANRAKKIVTGAKNTVNDIKSAVGNVQQSAQIVEELALLDVELLRIKKFDLPTQRNQINNDQKYFILGNDSIEVQDKKNADKKEAIDSLEKYYTERITTLEDQKTQLKEEYSKLNDGFYGLKKQKDQVDGQLKSDEKDEKINNQKNKTKFRPSFTEVIDGISFVLSTILEFISINNAKIEHLVDTTNEIISKAQTKSDLESAKLSRDTAIIIITSNKRQLNSINSILQFLELLTTILSSLINILSLLPPLVITGATIRLLTKLDKILNDSSSLLSVANLVVSKLIDDLNYQESRLLQLGNILDNNITGLTSQEISDILNSNRNQLGYLSGMDYKGFKFYIKEENDSKFNVKGNKRRYAVALNKDGNEILQSSSSFTLDPDVLVEELKLQIDQKGLVA